jgi:hypothetical protein
MKSIVSFLISSLLFTSFTWAQDGSTWEEMLYDPSINFYKTQQAFEADLGDRPYERGLGIKQYKRWEYYWQNRVDEKGNFPEPGHALKEMTNYYATHPSPENYKVGSGDWSLLGPIQKPKNGVSQPNGNGRILCITFHPTDPNTIYIGAASGGFF